MKLPKTTKAKQIGKRGSKAFEKIVADHGWIFRAFEDQDDYGIDGELEIVLSENQVSGITTKIQIKSHEKIDLSASTFEEKIELKHINYWSQFNDPVVVVAVDLSSGTCYWSSSKNWKFSSTKSHALVGFSKNSVLPKAFNQLRMFMISWREGSIYQSTLNGIISLHKDFADFDNNFMFNADVECEISLEEQRQLFSLYDRIHFARMIFGLDPFGMLPAEFWKIRNRLAWKHADLLFFPTATEMVAYLRSHFVDLVPEIIHKTSGHEFLSREGYINEYFEAVKSNFHNPKFNIGEPIYVTQFEDDRNFGEWMNKAIDARVKVVYGFGDPGSISSNAMIQNAPEHRRPR